MEIKYRVHSVNQQPVSVTATFDGQQVPAEIAGVVIELVSDDGSMGHTLRLVPTDMAATLALFAQDAEVVATYTAAV